MAHQSVDDITQLLGAARTDRVPDGPFARATPEGYRSMSHDVLRQTHAHDAAERPDGAACYAGAGAVLNLWTRRAPGGAPWVALVTSVTRNRKGIILNAGYRVLVDSAQEAAALAADPARALATLITRYGVSFYTGRRRVYFLPEHLVALDAPLASLGPDAFARAVGLETPPDGSQVAVNVAVSAGDEGVTRFSWFFVLDLTRYEQETRQRGR